MKKSTRALKAVETDEGRVMTMQSKAFTESCKPLCDYCAFSERFENFEKCWVDIDTSVALRKIGVRNPVTHCSMHQPIIAFREPLVGFDDVFNTFRPGKAWSSRVIKGDIVGLMNAKTETLFAKAQVISVHCGDIDAMIVEHQDSNHIILDDKQKSLRKVLARLYGPRVIKEGGYMSVIYMRRLNGANTEEYDKELELDDRNYFN